MKPVSRLHLRLLGRFALASDDAGAEPLRIIARKSRGLIGYLAMSPQQTASREELATLLWGGCSDQQARQSLRQALALLRKALGSPGYFVAGPATIQLQPGVWLTDLLEFERLSRSLDAADLKRAAGLFGGEFLAGLNLDEESFDEWLRSQRRRSQTAAARLCETFVHRPDLVLDCEDALTVAEKLQALDPLCEDWHRWSVTLSARYRGKREALAQADAFAKLLKRELDIAPEAETQSLVERIRSGEVAPAASRPSAANAISPSVAALAMPVAVASHARGAHRPVEENPPRSLPSAAGVAWRSRVNRVFVAGAVLTSLILLVQTAGLTNHPPSVPTPAGDNVARSSSATVAASRDSWRSPSRKGAEAQLNETDSLIPILILPFTVSGETNGSAQLIADMITDDLTNSLSRVSSFRVISRQTARTFQGQAVDVAAATR